MNEKNATARLEINEGTFMLIAAVLAGERKVESVPSEDVSAALVTAISILRDRGLMRPAGMKGEDE